MLKTITFTIEVDGEQVPVVVDGRDYGAYEDAFDRSAGLDVLGWRYKCVTFLVWHAMKRQGVAPVDSHEEFMALTPQIHSEAKVADPVPLEKTATTGM